MHSARPDHDHIPNSSPRRSLSVLWRGAPLILGSGLLAGLLTYGVLEQQQPIYLATSSVLAIQVESGDPLLMTAPTLPEGAVEEALHSGQLVEDVIARLGQSVLSPVSVQSIAASLRQELTTRDFTRLEVRSRLNSLQNGIYTVAARGGTSQEARVMADVAVAALLAWDQARAQQGIRRLRASVDTQLRSLDRRIAASLDSTELQTLSRARQSAAERRLRLDEAQQVASGTLSPRAAAVAPAAPLSPAPLRGALAAFAAVALMGALLTVLVDLRSQRLRNPGDPGLPVLGSLPRGPYRDMPNPAADFLRVNLLLRRPSTRRFVFSGPEPRQGVSHVVALLARRLAEDGQRVLLIDANRHAPVQHGLWGSAQSNWHLLPGAQPGAPPARSLGAALASPEGAQVRCVAPRLDLLGDGEALGNVPPLGLQPHLEALLERWAAAYDLVLIDTASLTADPDALTLGGAGALVLVMDVRRFQRRALDDALALTRAAGIAPVGMLWNNAPGVRWDVLRLGKPPRSRPAQSLQAHRPPDSDIV